METAFTFDLPLRPAMLTRSWRRAILLTGRLRQLAAPVVATGCIGAMSHPSPTTGFMLAVTMELGGRALRCASCLPLPVRKPGEPG